MAERPPLGAVLTELSSARVPWLALARDLRTRSDATVIDPADPRVPPVTVNPLEPEAGYPVQAHADRLAGLLAAAFGLPDPVAAAVRAGLQRAYADCGWDALTGGAPPGARIAPAVPAFGQLARAALAAAEDLGYDRRMRAAVSGFVHARLEPLWTGPAGAAGSPAGRCAGHGPGAGSHGQAPGRPDPAARVPGWLAGRPLPRVPAEVLSVWRALSPLRRECVLATVLDRAVTTRAAALRRSYDPAGLTSVVAAVADRMLDQAAVPFRAGPVWVIPQLRWLHEVERLNPAGRAGIRLDDIAPPLDFGLAGLPDWPGIRIRDRLGALGRHPLSMASPRNRRLACLALLGEDGRAGLDADLATATLGVPQAARPAYAARLMGAGAHGPGPGWLEVVLSWPDRFIRPAWDAETGLLPTATG